MITETKKTPLRLIIASFGLGLFLAGCGGGGGGGSGGGANPAVTVSGAKATYWQDEAIEISFSVANMDRATTNFSIAGLDEGYDFTLDSQAGTFQTVSDQYTDAGEYSYSVTATDGSGKTASRSFQFRVDAVITGLKLFDNVDGSRRLDIAASRDGLIAIFAPYLVSPVDELVVNNLTCFGETSVVGSAISGTLNCGGQYPEQLTSDGRASGLRAIGSIQIEIDVKDQNTGALTFLDSDGTQVEVWLESESTLQDAQSPADFPPRWPANVELQGKYIPYWVLHQYKARYSFQYVQDGNQIKPWDELSVDQPLIIVGPDYKIVSEGPANNSSACVINGEISQLSLDEYAFEYGNKSLDLRTGPRIISGEIDATNCSNLGVEFGDKTIDQPLGPFLASVGMSFYSPTAPVVDRLDFFGSGIDRPFWFRAVKICNTDGSATPFNNLVLQLSCE